MLQLIHSCDITRNVALGTNGRRQLQALATGVRCLAIPMNAQAAVQNGFDIGRAYDLYFDVTEDVKVGDKLTVAGDTYTVTARQLYQMPLVGHMHVMAKQEVS